MNRGDFKFIISRIGKTYRLQIKDFVKKHWGSEKIVYNGKVFYPHRLSGFIVGDKGKISDNYY